MKKVIFSIVLLVIIPALVVFGIGVYGYNRYQTSYTAQGEKNGYFEQYVEKDNTESEINVYLKFNSEYYKEELSKDILNSNGDRLFTIKMYSVLYDKKNGDNAEKSLVYEFYAFNIDYGMLYKEIYKSEANNKLGAYMPKLSIKLVDHEKIGTEDELSTDISLTALENYAIRDYNWVGYTKEDGTKTQKNSSGERINFSDYNKYLGTTVATAKVGPFAANKDYSSNIDLKISVTDPQYASFDESTVLLETININMVQKIKNYDVTAENIIKGFNENIFEAGYFKYAFKNYIWWECLIALVLTLFVTGATVIVWNNTGNDEENA